MTFDGRGRRRRHVMLSLSLPLCHATPEAAATRLARNSQPRASAQHPRRSHCHVVGTAARRYAASYATFAVEKRASRTHSTRYATSYATSLCHQLRERCRAR